MEKSLFYSHVDKNDNNSTFLEKIEKYCNENPTEQVYIINKPLGENKYNYRYEENAIVILSPKHKVIFLDLANNEDEFEEYYDDFIEDLSSLSDKFKYKEHIGRPREWKKHLTHKEKYDKNTQINDLLINNILSNELQRKNQLLISLLIGSINNIEKIGVDVPKTILDKIKKNIVLFDGQQTRFIYKEFDNKSVFIQGLSGTGKTELLLHKLKELYGSKEYLKIFFTCHNIALANNLKNRIPEFFNFMKVEKQIDWNNQLWVNHAWGSGSDKNSGLYSYICDFYKIPFLNFKQGHDYETIFSKALKYIEHIEDFSYAFDYILVDERQDFPDIFFELCEKITRHKVYIAGDVFQDIFDNISDTELNVDIVLNRCYRTDPRTLMFAQAIGMGLFESKKLNWLSDDYWRICGYNIKREKGNFYLSREPIRRFDELDLENIPSVEIKEYTKNNILNTIKQIQLENNTLKPDDIAIICLDDSKNIYEIIDRLAFAIQSEIGWDINRAYESKEKIENKLFISNRNNVKGLEFPFVICVTKRLENNYRYRNSLYTMLTRSFIKSYLFIEDYNNENIELQNKGLEIINNEKRIKTVEPTEEEKEQIRKTIIKVKEEMNMSFDELLINIFNELKIDSKDRKKLTRHINIEFENESNERKFDKDKIKEFIKKIKS
ncbi:DEAD/DEAH box helicase [Campylobacter sp. MOP7]|uniref:DEAD/DEAH box helicase n=1 Tax=Campylobacter canis TaxID=3378588 RepID=UPI00387E9116